MSFEGEDDDDDGSKSLDAEAERLELERLAKEQLEKARVNFFVLLNILLEYISLIGVND